MSTADNDEGQVLSPENWGQFNLYRAMDAIRRSVKGQAQHVALLLAHETVRRRCKNGVIEITHRELASMSGRAKDTIPVAIAECVEAGLLHQRRIRDGFKYTWGRVAYFPSEAHTVGRSAENAHSDNLGELRDAVRRLYRAVYLEVVLKGRHGIKWDSPKAAKLLRLSHEQESEILDNLVYFVVESKLEMDPAIECVFADWAASNGTNNFLFRARHPLARFADDVGTLVCRLLVKSGHALPGQTRAVPNLVGAPLALHPDVQQKTLKGAKQVLSVFDVPRAKLQRPDFKLAANA